MRGNPLGVEVGRFMWGKYIGVEGGIGYGGKLLGEMWEKLWTFGEGWWYNYESKNGTGEFGLWVN